MPRYLRLLSMLGALGLIPLAVALAQEEQPAPPEPPPASPRTAADLLDPDLLAVLAAQWGPPAPNEPLLTDGGNVTVLSVPEGCAVYVASVDEISAAGGDGGEATVEGVVFNDEHLMGNTPLTFAVPSGRHVLAVRSKARQDAFDGGCVRKSTYDVITGGRRYAYHLYPLDKKAGQYQCFVASFADFTKPPDDEVRDQAERGTFAVPLDELALRLKSAAGVADDELERVVTSLNQLGIAPFRKDGALQLVKLVLVGDGFQLLSWPIEQE
jgi:hypothetical protein